jgi:AraC family transcriptional regulator
MVARRLPRDAYYGRLVLQRRVARFLITESVFAPKATLPMHSHRQPYLTLTIRGGYAETYGLLRSRYCGPGAGIFHPDGEAHSQEFGATASVLLRVAFEPEWLECLGERRSRTDRSFMLDGGEPVHVARRIRQELAAPDDISPLMLEGLVCQLLGTALRTAEIASSARRRVREAEEILKASGTRPPGLSALATMLGASPATLSRDFRSLHHCSMGEYSRRLRIATALEYMRATESTLAEIATAVGFCDQSHFNRVFRSVVGQSPSSYRRNLRKSA